MGLGMSECSRQHLSGPKARLKLDLVPNWTELTLAQNIMA